jgi:hypothetical protein
MEDGKTNPKYERLAVSGRRTIRRSYERLMVSAISEIS